MAALTATHHQQTRGCCLGGQSTSGSPGRMGERDSSCRATAREGEGEGQRGGIRRAAQHEKKVGETGSRWSGVAENTAWVSSGPRATGASPYRVGMVARPKETSASGERAQWSQSGPADRPGISNPSGQGPMWDKVVTLVTFGGTELFAICLSSPVHRRDQRSVDGGLQWVPPPRLHACDREKTLALRPPTRQCLHRTHREQKLEEKCHPTFPIVVCRRMF